MYRPQKVLVSFSLALVGILCLFASTGWFLWKNSILAEEKQVSILAQSLGRHVERSVNDAIRMLDRLNSDPEPRCSNAHLRNMNQAAMAAAHIKAVGFWRADERQCGVGYVQLMKLRPPRADRIYDSGVIAWWPSEHTEFGGVRLFLIRYGDHDIAIDPKLLLDTGPIGDRQVALWMEGLPIAASPPRSNLPSPEKIPVGLTIERDNGRVLSRFSIDTLLPIDIVASEQLVDVLGRYVPTLAFTGGIGLVLIAVWIAIVYRYSRYSFSLSSELRHALSNDRIRVEYQPIIELSSRKCMGAEALARWVREDGEVIGPDTFIAVAEEAGLVPEITRTVLDAILRDLGDLLREQNSLSIHLNVAPQDLQNREFAAALDRSVTAAGVAPAAIKLEITERGLVNTDEARALIKEFRERGHPIAVDDFGTGYSSLSYLQSFALDALKIDKSFVDAIEMDAVTSNVIGPIIEMAAALELDTVAEGIENPHQADWLFDQGVSYGQGYLFSKSLGARQFRKFCREWGDGQE